MPRLSTLLGSGLITLCTGFAHPSSVSAYPVDCAILLCLAGGWPASTECAQARAVFIRRITPWPIEPPLQIWNCPMGVGFETPGEMGQLFDASARSGLRPPKIARPPAAPRSIADRADIDISDPAFDFVRSIRVFEIFFQQHRSSGNGCSSSNIVYLGSYGEQGEYTRRRSELDIVPQASAFRLPTECNGYTYRSVFVEWRDLTGAYGHEEIQY